jgi:hypothetical protein
MTIQQACGITTIVCWPPCLLFLFHRVLCSTKQFWDISVISGTLFAHSISTGLLLSRCFNDAQNKKSLYVSPIHSFDIRWLPYHQWFCHCLCMHPLVGGRACSFWGSPQWAQNKWLVSRWDNHGEFLHFSIWFLCWWAYVGVIQFGQNFWHGIWRSPMNCLTWWTDFGGSLYCTAFSLSLSGNIPSEVSL